MCISAISVTILTDPLRETAERRKIPGKIVSLRDEVLQTQMDDPKTQEILGFLERLIDQLQRHSDPKKVESEFLPLLKEILVDPSGRPLDEESVLGSDGNVYGKGSLCAYLSLIPKKEWHRCPLDPNSEIPFTTIPHPPAQALVRWLREKDPSFQPEFNPSYDLPPLPTEETFILQQLEEAREKRRQKKALAQQDFASKVTAMIQQTRQESTEAIQREFEKLDALEEVVAKEMEDALARIAAKDQVLIRSIEQSIETIEQNVKSLHEANEQIQTQLDRTDTFLAEVEREQQSLQQAINQTKIAVEEYKAEKRRKLLLLVAAGVSCAGAVWALQTAGIAAEGFLFSSSGNALIGISVCTAGATIRKRAIL